MTIYKNISVPVHCADGEELYNLKDIIHDIREAVHNAEKKPCTLIHNYKPPDDCVTCPFFKINVANAGDDASLECRILKRRFGIDMLLRLREERYPGCPMEEIE